MDKNLRAGSNALSGVAIVKVLDTSEGSESNRAFGKLAESAVSLSASVSERSKAPAAKLGSRGGRFS